MIAAICLKISVTTEKTVSKKLATRSVRWRVAFLIALLATPLVLVALGYALGALNPILGLLPLGSVFLGAPSYFMAGAPFFLYEASRGSRLPNTYASSGFVAHVAAIPAIFLILMSVSADFIASTKVALFVTFWGALFAPIYGWVFGVLYRLLTHGSEAVDAQFSVASLKRTQAAIVAAAYLVVGLALLAEIRVIDGELMAPSTRSTSRAIWTGASLGMVCGIAFFAIRLFETRRTPIFFAAYLLIGMAAAPLGAPIREIPSLHSKDYSTSLITLALAGLFMIVARLLAGPPQEAAS